jgi:hypothetical protein
MKKLILTAALALLPGFAFAESTAFVQTGCEMTPAENGNWLTYKGTCAGGEVITGGYATTTETTEIDLGCETATLTERVTRESRGGREESRDLADVSFE